MRQVKNKATGGKMAAIPAIAPPIPALKPARVARITIVKPPHGMSVAAKPVRIPHPTAAGRDIYGRMMPGQLPPTAAPPFQAAVPKPMASRPSVPIRPAPMPLAPPPQRTNPIY